MVMLVNPPVKKKLKVTQKKTNTTLTETHDRLCLKYLFDGSEIKYAMNRSSITIRSKAGSTYDQFAKELRFIGDFFFTRLSSIRNHV